MVAGCQPTSVGPPKFVGWGGKSSVGNGFCRWAKIFQPTKKNEKNLQKNFSTRFQKFPFFSKTERIRPKICRLAQNFPTDEKTRKNFQKLFISTRFQNFLFFRKPSDFVQNFVGRTQISSVGPKFLNRQKKILTDFFFEIFFFRGSFKIPARPTFVFDHRSGIPCGPSSVYTGL